MAKKKPSLKAVSKKPAPVSFVESVRKQQAVKNARVSGKPPVTENNSPQSISAVALSVRKQLDKTPVLRGYDKPAPDQAQSAGYAAGAPKAVSAKSPAPGKQGVGGPAKKYEKKPGRNAHGKALFSNFGKK